MELNDLLAVMDRAAANLAKLEEVWNRAAPFIPTGPARGSHPEYDDLRRTWEDLLAGLPRVDGWTITEPLPDIDEVGQAFLDYAEISEPPFAVHEAANKPASDIGEYRFRYIALGAAPPASASKSSPPLSTRSCQASSRA